MKSMKDFSFTGQKVLVRVDFNVPLDSHFNVTDDTRISKAAPTINRILKQGGAVILMSHLGRPKGAYEEKYSLKHIIPAVEKNLNCPVLFADDCVGKDAIEKAESLQMGEVLLLENLRFHAHETTGTVEFARALAALGDFYVNDAFGTAHRAHASTTVMAQFFPGKKCFGLLMEDEIINIDKFLKMGEKPLTAIMGGAKVSSKISVLENVIPKVNHLIIGGGMIYSFIKAQGGKVGSSLVEDDKLDLANRIIALAAKHNVQLHLPADSVVADSFSNEANTQIVNSDQIPDGWMGLDIGPKAITHFSNVILQSKTVLWNGPMGVFEMSNFEKGTREIANALSAATKQGAFTLVGGGDSVAAINQFDMADEVSYISTGGGALMEYLEGITLPGIGAIQS